MLTLLLGLAALAGISTVFGMMMAVSQDLPELDNFAHYRTTQNTVAVDATGERIGTLTSNENKILIDSGDISANIKNAVVAIEDSRFYEHRGVDFQGIGRALVQDIASMSLEQGGSTITQQFVKQATETQDERTPMQKLREAALSYHLERNWTKDRILTAYLNTVYFGQGAYGIEAAARTYFGHAHPNCGTEAEPCASVLDPAEAAMLAGIVQSPSAWDPKANPDSARQRRDTVLQRMLEQSYISQEQYEDAASQALPAPNTISPPTIDSEAPYFTTWLRQQLVDRFGPARAFFGGYRVKTTLDLELQDQVQSVIDSYLSGYETTASMVLIDNQTGGVKAMIGGPDFEQNQFNLATNAARQPGSSIKPFTLITAMQEGVSPDSVWESAPKEFPVPGSRNEVFPVANYEDNYLGSASLRTAMTYSDNSVYAEVGVEVGTRQIARTIHRMGYSSPISTNPAMTLGGLKRGVNPLEWTYAFSTLANDGRRVTGTLANDYRQRGFGPVAYTRVVRERDKRLVVENKTESTQIIPEDVAAETKEILSTVISTGTGTSADFGNATAWGKTGTTDNYGDAWFCGGIDIATACVWVGHADSNEPMETEYQGSPVAGGTYPALIWRDAMSDWVEIVESRAEADEDSEEDSESPDAAPTEPDVDSDPPPVTVDESDGDADGDEQAAEVASEPTADADQQEQPADATGEPDSNVAPLDSPEPQGPAQAPPQQSQPATPAPPEPQSGGGISPSGGAPPG